MEHTNLPAQNLADVQDELDETEDLFLQMTGSLPQIIRAPYGAYDDRVKELLGAKRYIIIHYSINLKDYKYLSAAKIVKAMKVYLPPLADTLNPQIERGGVVLLHEQKWTAEALPDVIEYLLDSGYEIVPLPMMMKETEKNALFKSYKCASLFNPLMDLMCQQLEPHYDYRIDWTPNYKTSAVETPEWNVDLAERHKANQEAHDRQEFMLALFKEQLSQEEEARKDADVELLADLNEFKTVAIESMDKNYALFNVRLDNTEVDVQKELEKVTEVTRSSIVNLVEEVEQIADSIAITEMKVRDIKHLEEKLLKDCLLYTSDAADE
eukprot:TRINITY_DN5252_c0_g1_i2.p1 TRINITY_DN5252_c0_g1~~TRINITY_DN5252_c0_g1_i2.p1  ORF type:complete len:366 (-),score=75.45 TRINITY_DN5252_c0_g1_i2:21-992(-)